MDYIFSIDNWRALLLTLLTSAVIYVLVYTFTQSNFHFSSRKKVFNPSDDSVIVFITAHPDDECMFFGPTILDLAQRNPSNVHLLCLTTGNFYSKGHMRQKELYRSCEVLGISAANILILDNSSFLDGSQEWDFHILLPELLNYQRRVNADYIFTFDNYGVSGHPNHIATSQAVRQVCKELPSDAKIPVLFELESVPMYRKYLSFLDSGFSAMSSHLYFISSPSEILRAQKAMLAHNSQLVWFRWLYIVFSRYMLINTFKEVALDSSPTHD